MADLEKEEAGFGEAEGVAPLLWPHLSSESEAVAWLVPLVSFAEKTPHALAVSDLLAPGNPFYYTAGFVENLTPQLAAFLAKAQVAAGSQTGIHAAGAIVIMPLAGPFNEVAPDATAISARNAKFWVVFLLRLDGDEAQMAEGIAWGRALKKARPQCVVQC